MEWFMENWPWLAIVVVFGAFWLSMTIGCVINRWADKRAEYESKNMPDWRFHK